MHAIYAKYTFFFKKLLDNNYTSSLHHKHFQMYASKILKTEKNSSPENLREIFIHSLKIDFGKTLEKCFYPILNPTCKSKSKEVAEVTIKNRSFILFHNISKNFKAFDLSNTSMKNFFYVSFLIAQNFPIINSFSSICLAPFKGYAKYTIAVDFNWYLNLLRS